MKWRVIRNKYNLEQTPWAGAIGIEEDADDGAVPAIVCWFTRGWANPREMVEQVIRAHNKAEEP